MALTTAVSDSGRYDIVIEQPPVNAFSIGLLRDLTEAVRSLPEQARVVVLRSVGRGFCGGGDVKEVQSLPGFEGILGHGRYSLEVGVAIEVKSLPVKYPGIEETLVKALRDADMAQDSAVISFDHRVVRRVRELDQDVVGGVLVAGRPLLLQELLLWADAEVYSPHWSFVDSETVAEVHRAGAVIGVWTVDDEETLERCRGLGIDAVYTNRPRRLKEALELEPPG